MAKEIYLQSYLWVSNLVPEVCSDISLDVIN